MPLTVTCYYCFMKGLLYSQFYLLPNLLMLHVFIISSLFVKFIHLSYNHQQLYPLLKFLMDFY